MTETQNRIGAMLSNQRMSFEITSDEAEALHQSDVITNNNHRVAGISNIAVASDTEFYVDFDLPQLKAAAVHIHGLKPGEEIHENQLAHAMEVLTYRALMNAMQIRGRNVIPAVFKDIKRAGDVQLSAFKEELKLEIHSRPTDSVYDLFMSAMVIQSIYAPEISMDTIKTTIDAISTEWKATGVDDALIQKVSELKQSFQNIL